MIPRTPQFLLAQDRVKVSHFTRQGFDLGTVVHVGASTGLEAYYYLLLGAPRVLLFEPLPLAVDILRGRFGTDPRVAIFPLGLSDHSSYAYLRITTGIGKGSSFLDEVRPVLNWQPSDIVGRECLPLQRFDSLDLHCELEPNDRNPAGGNTLVIDVQGMELQVLKGFGECLRQIAFINVECSREPLYEGEASAAEVEQFLDEQGFDRDSPIVRHDDVMYIRKGLK